MTSKAFQRIASALESRPPRPGSRILADILFQDGTVRTCSGTVQGGVKNVSPGHEVPWRDGQSVPRHARANGLEVVRVWWQEAPSPPQDS